MGGVSWGAAGIWILVTMVQPLSFAVYYLVMSTSASRNALSGTVTGGQGLVMIIGSGVCPLVSATALLVLAPRISRWVCRDVTTGTKAVFDGIGPGDAYRIACLVMGLVALIRSISPLTAALVTILRASSGVPSNAITSLLTGVVLAAVSLVLILGARGMGQFLGRIGYDHDRVADQNFSLRAWFILIALLAVVLMVARRLTR